MKRKRKISDSWWPLINILLFFVVFFYIERVFMRVPLMFFFMWIACPYLAWRLRSASLDKSLTTRGYSHVRGLLLGIAVVISMLFAAKEHSLRDKLVERYPNEYYYYESTGYEGQPIRGVSANSFSGKVVLDLYPLVMLGMFIGVPVLTWKIASASIKSYERRKRELNNHIDSDE